MTETLNRNGQSGISWGSTIGNAKPCTWGRNNPRHATHWGLSSCTASVQKRIWGGSYWTTNQPWASTAPLWQSILDCFRKNTGSRSREADSLHRTGEITSGVPYPVLGCTVEERNGRTAASPAKGHKYEWGTGVCFIQGKRELRLFSIEKLGGNLFSVYKYPMRKCREEGTKIFSVVATDSTSGNKYKMKREKIHLLLCECPETGCPEGLCSLYL